MGRRLTHAIVHLLTFWWSRWEAKIDTLSRVGSNRRLVSQHCPRDNTGHAFWSREHATSSRSRLGAWHDNIDSAAPNLPWNRVKQSGFFKDARQQLNPMVSQTSCVLPSHVRWFLVSNRMPRSDRGGSGVDAVIESYSAKHRYVHQPTGAEPILSAIGGNTSSLDWQ